MNAVTNFLKKIFTWWEGATIGTMLNTAIRGHQVGEDALGNRYYHSKDGTRRWVIYNGANDAARVPPEWHGWLHSSYDEIPESHLPPPRIWEREPAGNLTGTDRAYRPAGALESGGARARARGDYEAWTPDAP